MASTKNGIIYPDNYDKVADVPADMKVLAESVDGNIERLNKNLDKNADELKNLQKDNTGNKTAIEAINKKNTEQDTNLQKNVKDIEANQNNIKALQVKNAEVKAENERLRSDIESISLVGEAEGESIDLDDSSGARFKKFEIGGNHKQETREGYNILDLSKKPYNEQASSLNGATVTQKNGILTIDATSATNLVTIKSVWTSYTNSTNIKMPKGNYYTPLILNINKAEGGESVGQKTGNITLEEDCVCAQWFYNVKKGQKIELPLFISNNQNKRTYEQYGATPSLKFPSEITTVKDNINLTVANKNYISIENTSKTINGITFTVNSDGSILANGTATDRVSYPIQNNFKKFEAGQYFVSGCPSGGSEATYYLILWNENWFSMGSEYGKGRLVSLSNQKVKLHINIMKGTVCNNLLFKPQMEKETKATDYEAHQEQTITMPVQQDMLKEDYFDWENEKEVHNWGKSVFDENDNIECVHNNETFQFKFARILENTSLSSKTLCNISKHWKSNTWNENGCFISYQKYLYILFKENEFGFNADMTTNEAISHLKEKLNQNNLICYYQLTTQTELDFTYEQKVVAKKIKETLHTYKNITHIYSTDETSPIMNVEYAKDINTTISNIQALILNNASEEVNG